MIILTHDYTIGGNLNKTSFISSKSVYDERVSAVYNRHSVFAHLI
jgi:hypothetical protein